MKKTIQSTEISSSQEWARDPNMVEITLTDAILQKAAQCIPFMKENGVTELTLDESLEYKLYECASSDEQGEGALVKGPDGDYIAFEPEYGLSCCNMVIHNGYIDAVMSFKHSGDRLTVSLGSLKSVAERLGVNLIGTGFADDEKIIADFMLNRIESGDLALEDIPVRLARYGLMERTAFIVEMRERMEMAKEG